MAFLYKDLGTMRTITAVSSKMPTRGFHHMIRSTLSISMLLLSTTASAQVLNKLSASEGEQIWHILRTETDVTTPYGPQSFSVQPDDGGDYYYLGSSITEKKITNSIHWRFFCTFELFDNRWKSISRINAHIKDYEQTNVCQRILGLAGISWWNNPTGRKATSELGNLEFQKGFIAILQYTGGLPAIVHSVSKIGSNTRWTATLFLFKKDLSGWSIVQDDSCFDPMNQIDTLAKAKKAFDTCHPVLK